MAMACHNAEATSRKWHGSPATRSSPPVAEVDRGAVRGTEDITQSIPDGPPPCPTNGPNTTNDSDPPFQHISGKGDRVPLPVIRGPTAWP